MIRNAHLGAEIIHDSGRSAGSGLLGHGLEEALQLAEVVTLAGGGALDEPLPRVRVREAGVDDAVEDVVFGFDGDDGAVGAGLEVVGSVLLG